MWYIYENWRAGKHKAVIHHGSCGHCNSGKGHSGGHYDLKNARWHGPYDKFGKAQKAQQLLDVSVRKLCAACVAKNR